MDWILMESVLQSILSRLDRGHANALEWFAEHEGDVGRRPWRKAGASIVPGVDFPMVAQRGIHKPAGMDVAISITAAAGDAYLDGTPTQLSDGTWVLLYRAHVGGDGGGEDSRWNRALLMNKFRQLPVGVFVHVKGSDYRNLGLAMVEDYYEDDGAFLLRGPLRLTQQAGLWLDEAPEWHPVSLGLDIAETPEKTPAMVTRRIAQDRFRQELLRAYASKCAITNYDAEPALQAAHILSYRGTSSQRIDNGLLLRADLHLLYDRHLLSVSPDRYTLSLSNEIRNSQYGNLHGRQLTLPVNTSMRPRPEHLAVHWAVFEGRNA